MLLRRGVWRKRSDEGAAEEHDRAKGADWKPWARNVAVILIVLGVVLGGAFLYAGTWPPFVIAESPSMQHSETTSSIGTIDVGDVVFVQAAPLRVDIITYVQGRSARYSTYGDYGDVVIFRVPHDLSAGPVAHRAIMYVIPNGTGTDVPDLAGLPTNEWQGYRDGVPVSGARDLTSVTIDQMGYDHDRAITFDLAHFLQAFPGRAGYVTMGDLNVYRDCTAQPVSCVSLYDTSWFPAQSDIMGVVRGEIPWIGLVKLLLLPTATCAHGWADPCAPLNSWDDLAFSLAILFTLPIAIEGIAWAWSTYAWPRIRPRMPRILGKFSRQAPVKPNEDTQRKEGSPGKRSS